MKVSNWRYFAVAGGIAAVAGALWYARRREGERLSARVVDHVDIGRFVGKWYEIAHYPAAPEAGCFGTTYEYSLRPDGYIVMLRTCRRGSFDGRLESGEGVAVITDKATNAKLRVRSYWPFNRDYRIIGLDAHYQYAIVSDPGKTALWILSRTPAIDEGVYGRITERLAAIGFDKNRLRRTPQLSGEPAAAR